ncbi:hypothetical protein Hanom_Chr13g01190321 [Helianthus anomalus]
MCQLLLLIIDISTKNIIFRSSYFEIIQNYFLSTLRKKIIIFRCSYLEIIVNYYIFNTLKKRFFFEPQIWSTDGSLEHHRATNGTIRSYSSPLGIMPIHQFRRKPHKYRKTPLWESNT